MTIVKKERNKFDALVYNYFGVPMTMKFEVINGKSTLFYCFIYENEEEYSAVKERYEKDTSLGKIKLIFQKMERDRKELSNIHYGGLTENGGK